MEKENLKTGAGTKSTLISRLQTIVTRVIKNPLILINILMIIALFMTWHSTHKTGEEVKDIRRVLQEHSVIFQEQAQLIVRTQEAISGSIEKQANEVINIRKMLFAGIENPLHLNSTDGGKAIWVKNSDEPIATINEICITIGVPPGEDKTVFLSEPRVSLSLTDEPLIITRVPEFQEEMQKRRSRIFDATISITFLYKGKERVQEWKCKLVKEHELIFFSSIQLAGH